MGTTRSSNTKPYSNGDNIESQYIRRAKHAGSWYSASSKVLAKELSDYLSKAALDDNHKSNSGTSTTASTSSSSSYGSIPCGIIAPHAGYYYCGSTAAYAYMGLKEALEQGRIDTIVVLHPSHYVHLDGCAISNASILETPVGNLTVSSKLRSKLLSCNKFTSMTQGTDEKEHSGEMQYPYIAHILKECGKGDIAVLPIMIGSLSSRHEEEYGAILKDILTQSNIFTIISSDFCHWGARFQYTPHDKTKSATKSISSYIKWLDHLGMELIELKKPGAFVDYLKTYKNTICGRHPISVWLFAVVGCQEVCSVRFVKYSQSSEVIGMGDSSVSYASAIAYRKL